MDLHGPTEWRMVRDMVAKMDKAEATVAEAARLAAGDENEAAPVPAGGGVAAADSGERGRASWNRWPLRALALAPLLRGSLRRRAGGRC